MSVADVAKMCPVPVVVLNKSGELLLLKYRNEGGADVVVCRDSMTRDEAHPGAVVDANAAPGAIAICQIYDLPAEGPLMLLGVGELDDRAELAAYGIVEQLLGDRVPR